MPFNFDLSNKHLEFTHMNIINVLKVKFMAEQFHWITIDCAGVPCAE